MSQKKVEQRQSFLGPRCQQFKKPWHGNKQNSNNNNLAAALLQMLKKDDPKKEEGTSKQSGGQGGDKKLSIKQLKAIKPCSK